MVAFYKHDIIAWRGGTAALSDRAYRVYHVIVEQIMQNEGPIPLHELSLAGLSNRSVRDFKLALAELVDCGKLRIDGNLIHNARAETELSAIEINRHHAAMGGRSKRSRRPIDENSPESQPRETGERSANTPRDVGENLENINKNNDRSEATLPSASKPKRLREDVDKEEKSNKKNSGPDELFGGADAPPADPPVKPTIKLSEAFAQWYAAYPHKIGPAAAEKSFAKVFKSRKATFSELMAGLENYKRTKPDDRAWCNPATWLNQGRWADAPADGAGSPAMMAADGPNWETRLAFFKAKSQWTWVDSPPPGSPGCLVPDDLLAKFNLPPTPQQSPSGRSSIALFRTA